MSQRKAKFKPKTVNVSGLKVMGQDGRVIENPTPFQTRMAILALLESTGAAVMTIKVDGHLCAFVHANPQEIPDSESDSYYEHLEDATKVFTDSIRGARNEVKAMGLNSTGGDG